ncbi:MAG: hypothetical protein HOJ57_38995 [Lentisphaerae bacterium]|nr:hypothetical protein [Lentisphaerota bacterium]MBT5611992.1 hypothetical protein [Lentisphaerota bacterium]MBT7061263.1 hypothetical protein [Lentisphaerota bacterium]
MTTGTSSGAKFTIGDVLRREWSEYCRRHDVPDHQQRVLWRLCQCRTPDLGGYGYPCDKCGHERRSFNACRSRHRPTCEAKLGRGRVTSGVASSPCQLRRTHLGLGSHTAP